MARATNPKIKKANLEVEFTAEQVQELQKCTTDPIYFIRNYVMVQHPTRGSVPFDLYPYQENMINMYVGNRYSIVLSARQTGKEQPHSAAIAVPTGWTTMGEIKVGDDILVPTGETVKVLDKFPQGIKQVYKLTFDDGSYANCGLEHLWSVTINGEAKVITLSDIITHRRNHPTDTISIPTVDKIDFDDEMLFVSPLNMGKNLNHGNLEIGIPDEYKQGSFNDRMSLLRGILAVDGDIGNNLRHIIDSNGTVQHVLVWSTTSQVNSIDVQQLVWSVGGKCTIDSWDGYTLNITLPNSDVPLTRTITNIEDVGTEESSCILVDHPDHLYITDNYTVTHNSVTSAAYLLWYAMFHFDKTILIASNKNSNAMEMIVRMRFAYENIPNWLKPGIQEDGWNKHNIGFDNGSRVVSTATSEDSGRGMSISLLFLDEFAFVKPAIQDEFWTSIAPTLSTGGSCIMTSTPNGDMDIFAQIWRGAQVNSNGFASIHVGWDEPPGRGDKFKEDEIGRIGERRWMQEYECCSINTVIEVQSPQGEIIHMTMGHLYDTLHQEYLTINR